MRSESDQCSYRIAAESRSGQAYNEEAFRHFLAIERKRSERSKRSVLLLLANLSQQPGASGIITPMIAAKLFSGLWRCVRETDFMGWYRDGRVVGAVLTQLTDATGTDVSRLVGQRVREGLCRSLPSSIASRLRVRVYQLPRWVKARLVVEEQASSAHRRIARTPSPCP